MPYPVLGRGWGGLRTDSKSESQEQRCSKAGEGKLPQCWEILSAYSWPFCSQWLDMPPRTFPLQLSSGDMQKEFQQLFGRLRHEMDHDSVYFYVLSRLWPLREQRQGGFKAYPQNLAICYFLIMSQPKADPTGLITCLLCTRSLIASAGLT